MKRKTYFPVREIKNLKEMLELSDRLFKDLPAFEVKKEDETCTRISYTGFKTEVDALGTALISLGLKDTYIALIGENRYEWCLSYLAVTNGTGVIVPLDRDVNDEELENLLKRSRAAAVVFSGKYEQRLNDLAQKIPGIKYFINMDNPEDKDERFLSFQKLLQTGYRLLSSGDRRFLDAVIDAEKISVLLFTSGTTGVTKGVMLSQRNLCSNVMAISKTLYFDEKDRIMCILPLHHSYGMMTSVLVPLYRGFYIGFNESIKYLARNIKDFQPTVLTLVPLIVENIHKKIWKQIETTGKSGKIKIAFMVSDFMLKLGIDLRPVLFKDIHSIFGGRLKIVICGAAALDPKVAKFFRKIGITLLPGYGLTECSPVVSSNTLKHVNECSVGFTLPCFEVKIAADSGQEIGEILVKGASVMLGYFEDEEGTNRTIIDGWLHTGDLGYIDRKGFLYIAGREKNVIVLQNGKNIYPEAIEDYLNRSEFIVESFVYGEEDQDSKEITILAQIVPDLEAIKSTHKKEEFSEAEIYGLISREIGKVNKTLPSYKQVRHFSIRHDEFEKTSTQKIKRYKVLAG